jgi:hypothetical protein
MTLLSCQRFHFRQHYFDRPLSITPVISPFSPMAAIAYAFFRFAVDWLFRLGFRQPLAFARFSRHCRYFLR